MSLNNGYEESNTGDNRWFITVIWSLTIAFQWQILIPIKDLLKHGFHASTERVGVGNTLAWQEARKARIILGKTNGNTSANIQITSSMLTKNWIAPDLGHPLVLDATISETTKPEISADILNVLDSKTAVDTTNTVWRPTPVAVLSGLMSA